MRKHTTLIQLQTMQTSMYVIVCLLDIHHLATGWPHGHGLQPTAKAVAKNRMRIFLVPRDHIGSNKDINFGIPRPEAALVGVAGGSGEGAGRGDRKQHMCNEEECLHFGHSYSSKHWRTHE